VLIADGMSTDNTREFILRLIESTDVPVKIIDNSGKIVPTGFNAALREARGEIIVRVDGHCEIAPDYVSQCVKHLLDEDIAGVGGPIDTVSQNHIGETIAVAMSSVFGVGGSAFRTIKDKAVFADTIAFPAYKRDVFQRVGQFDEELVRNQDDEYNYRLRAHGYKLLLTPTIKSRYYSRGALSKLWKQYYQYGLYKVRVMQKHPRQMRPRQFAPALLVFSFAIGVGLSRFSKVIRRLWLALIAVYTCGNMIASFVTARRAGWKHLGLLPIVYATLHFSYGTGFLFGLVKFRNRWRQ
jgi:GT2 family glycosyltransferase